MANKGFKILPYNYLADWGEFESFNGTFPEGWLVSTAVAFNLNVGSKSGEKALLINGNGGVYRTIPDGEDYSGRTFKLGIWASASKTSPFIKLSDGVSAVTAHVAGGSAYAFVTTPSLKLDVNATELRVDLQGVFAVNTLYDGAVLCEGEDLFTELNANIDVAGFSPSMALGMDRYKIANKEGSLVQGYHLDENNIRMNGSVVGSDVTSCRNHFDLLLKALLSWQKNEKRNLYLYDDRILEVFLKSFKWNYYKSLQFIKYDMAFIVPEGTSRSLGMFRHREVTSGTAQEFSFSYGGNAESLPNIAFIANQGGAITTCSLENLTNGHNLAYTGTVPTNVSLGIDCFNATVQNSGIDKIEEFTGDFIAIIRGTNYFKYSGSPCQINIDYFERNY